MERIENESFFLGSPGFTDVFVRREAFQGLETPAVVIGVDEVGEVIFELGVAIVMMALYGRFLDRPVHALDLPVGPRMLDLGEPVLDAVLPAPHVEHMHHGSRCRPSE
jgi:hypothetical protein